MSGLDGELLTKAKQIHAGQVRLLKISWENDGMGDIQTCSNQNRMHLRFIPGKGSTFRGINAIDAVLVHPLDKGHKLRVKV
jgi:hypothetical protein